MPSRNCPQNAQPKLPTKRLAETDVKRQGVNLQTPKRAALQLEEFKKISQLRADGRHIPRPTSAPIFGIYLYSV